MLAGGDAGQDGKSTRAGLRQDGGCDQMTGAHVQAPAKASAPTNRVIASSRILTPAVRGPKRR